jgi:Protein of unknown function (DUF4230)
LQKIDIIPSFKNWFKSKPVSIENTALIITQIKNIAELASMQVYAEMVVDSTEYSKAGLANQALKSVGMMNLPFLEPKKLVLIVNGKVQAGVDLKKLSAEDIYAKDDSVSIHLPKAEILNLITNPSDFDTFLEEGNWSDEAVTAVKQKARKQLQAKAMDMHLLEKANEHARVIITQLLRSMGFEKVHFING